jgi:hypothetical protein
MTLWAGVLAGYHDVCVESTVRENCCMFLLLFLIVHCRAEIVPPNYTRRVAGVVKVLRSSDRTALAQSMGCRPRYSRFWRRLQKSESESPCVSTREGSAVPFARGREALDRLRASSQRRLRQMRADPAWQKARALPRSPETRRGAKGASWHDCLDERWGVPLSCRRREKRSKRCGRCSGAMPIPVSWTISCAVCGVEVRST